MGENSYEKIPVALAVPETKRYRPSRYNHFHTLPSGEKLAYNALSNALAVLDREGVERYGRVKSYV